MVLLLRAPVDSSAEAPWVSTRWRLVAILREADEVVDVCPDPYAVWKMQRRNERMVDHTDLLIAVWDGGPGGTANTIRYARSNGFPSGSSMYRCEG